jgi:hypothetical protein
VISIYNGGVGSAVSELEIELNEQNLHEIEVLTVQNLIYMRAVMSTYVGVYALKSYQVVKLYW